MRKLACFLLVAVALLFNSCMGNQCEKFDFVDSFASVQNNVLALDSLMSAGNTSCNARYTVLFLPDSLLIMDRNKSDSFTLKAFCASAEKQNVELKRLSSFMRRNSISSASLRDGIYFYNFNYCNPNNDFRYIRYVVINKDSVKSKLGGHRVLDAREDLLLVAPIDIRTD